MSNLRSRLERLEAAAAQRVAQADAQAAAEARTADDLGAELWADDAPVDAWVRASGFDATIADMADRPADDRRYDLEDVAAIAVARFWRDGLAARADGCTSYPALRMRPAALAVWQAAQALRRGHPDWVYIDGPGRLSEYSLADLLRMDVDELMQLHREDIARRGRWVHPAP